MSSMVTTTYKQTVAFITFLAVNRPGAFDAIVRLCPNEDLEMHYSVDDYCRPIRFILVFPFKLDELKENESINFDRIYDSEYARMVLACHPDACLDYSQSHKAVSNKMRNLKSGDVISLNVDYAQRGMPGIRISAAVKDVEAYMATLELPDGTLITRDVDELAQYGV